MLTDSENEFMLMGGKSKGKEIGELETDKYTLLYLFYLFFLLYNIVLVLSYISMNPHWVSTTLLYLKSIVNKDLQYNTWNSAQCYVAAWIKEEFEGE